MNRKFRIIESPEPVSRRSGTASRRMITDITDMVNSTVTLYASTRVLHNEHPNMIQELNKAELQEPRRWRVNMAYPLERSGIQQFKSVPLDILIAFWNKPINIIESGMTYAGNGIYRFTNEEYFISRKLTCFFLWNEIGVNPTGPVIGTHGSPLDDNVRKTLSWMEKHSPVIIPFGDRDTIFIDAETEVAYISDLMG